MLNHIGTFPETRHSSGSDDITLSTPSVHAKISELSRPAEKTIHICGGNDPSAQDIQNETPASKTSNKETCENVLREGKKMEFFCEPVDVVRPSHIREEDLI